jgi:chemotaxis protein methyltransferase CheR
MEQIYQPVETNDCSKLEKLEIGLLLEGIYRHYGLDFRNYNFSSVRRRIWHRIQLEKLTSVTTLLDRVLREPQMMDKLFSDLSINVTEMFRDPDFFKAFRMKVAPVLKEVPIIRIWHAGCSTGEEAYSMAILLHEEGLLKKAKIYATDMNERVIMKAKVGRFPLNKMQGYTSNYVASGGKQAFSEYYKVVSEEVEFHPFLRENIVFAQHNLVTDSSFNEFHVIICRNVMIYFDRDLQDRVHHLMFESLAPSGFLGLGNRESISYTKFNQFYQEIDSNGKIYQKMKL